MITFLIICAIACFATYFAKVVGDDIDWDGVEYLVFFCLGCLVPIALTMLVMRKLDFKTDREVKRERKKLASYRASVEKQVELDKIDKERKMLERELERQVGIGQEIEDWQKKYLDLEAKHEAMKRLGYRSRSY